MKKILIISTSVDEQKIIEGEVAGDAEPIFEVTSTASFGQEASWWNQNSPDALILRLPEDDLLQGYFFTKMRKDVPRSLPAIILAATVSAPLLKLSTEFQKVRILKYPFEGSDLLKTLVDITTDRGEGREQAHTRYFTDIAVSVSSDFHPNKVSGIAKNLSVGGAYIEAKMPDWKLNIGEVIKLNIGLAGSKPYQFNAKVVWLQTGEVDEVGFGVAFVDQNELYNNLLKGV